jgi:hypothetical protein
MALFVIMNLTVLALTLASFKDALAGGLFAGVIVALILLLVIANISMNKISRRMKREPGYLAEKTGPIALMGLCVCPGAIIGLIINQIPS